MKLIALVSIFALGLATSLKASDVKVVLNPKMENVTDALIVLFPEKVSVIKGQTTFKYEVLNRSQEDVFVVVESKNVEGWKDFQWPAGRMAGGGRAFGMENTHEKLRLLYAPRREANGIVSTGEDDMASRTSAEVKVEAGSPADLSQWVGGKGTLQLQLKFYVGNSKVRRIAQVSVPIEILSSDQNPSVESKPSN